MPPPTSAHTLPRRLQRLDDDGHLLRGIGPLLRVSPGAPSSARDSIRAAWRHGHLLRLTRGYYLDLRSWNEMAPWDRHTVAAAAYSHSHPGVVFTGATAAHLHGLPLTSIPGELRLRASARGHRGRRPMASAPFSETVLGSPEPLPPRPPQVRWQWNGVQAPAVQKPRDVRRRRRLTGDGWKARPVSAMSPVTIEARLKDGTPLGPVTVDPLPTVQLLLGSTLPFREAVVALDGLHRMLPGPSETWAEKHAERLETSAARTRFETAWEFSDARSESAGESLARALIHELGFAAPELQRKIFSRDGREVARVDFWWEQVRVAGEFDGIGKYDVDLHTSTRERRRSINREKSRDVELQRVCRHVTHWTWADLKDPARLEAELLRVGVPRRRR